MATKPKPKKKKKKAVKRHNKAPGSVRGKRAKQKLLNS